MNFKHTPNILSMLRIILTVPIIISLLKAYYLIALILFFIASITDVLDGFIAKHFDYQTWVGSIIDPLADKILLVGLVVGLYMIDLLPVWLLIIIVLRDIILITSIIGRYYHLFNTGFNITPSNISKLNTVLQMLMILVIIIGQIYPIGLVWINMIYIVVATSTVISGVDYIWIWIRDILIRYGYLK